MNHTYRKALISGAIATLIATPGWAVATPQQSSATQDENAGQTMHMQKMPDASTVPLHAIYGKTPQELRRMAVVGPAGHAVGTLKDIVAERDGGKVCVVLSVGGIMGMGARDVVVPVDQLQLHGDKLQLMVSDGNLDSRPAYRRHLFREVQPEDRPISEFSAFEAAPSATSHPGA